MNLTQSHTGSNSDLRGEESASNRLSYGKILAIHTTSNISCGFILLLCQYSVHIQVVVNKELEKAYTKAIFA
jgi:hypothetical protein